MFGNKSQSIKTLGKTVESFQTMIGEATEIHGRLVASESLRIDGKVVGNVETSQDGVVSIAVGKNGIVQGDIYAYRVIIAGRVEGNVYCTERVELHNGAIVHGDVTYGQIGIEPGARLNGLMISRSKDLDSGPQDSNQVFKKNWEKNYCRLVPCIRYIYTTCAYSRFFQK